MSPTPKPYLELCLEAIVAVADRKGASNSAIKKYIISKYGEEFFQLHHYKRALNKALEAGTVTKTKDSYKLSPKSKEKHEHDVEDAPASAKKGAVAKKAAPKGKVAKATGTKAKAGAKAKN